MVGDFVVASAGIVVFVLLSWGWVRSVSRGRPLNPFKRQLLIYSTVFVAGMVYLLVFAPDLGWSDDLMFSLIAL